MTATESTSARQLPEPTVTATSRAGGQYLARALPAFHWDRIVEGLPGSAAVDGRKQWGACISIAMSAQRRGWTRADYVNTVMSSMSKLARQLEVDRKGRLRPKAAVFKTVHDAWDQALEYNLDLGLRTHVDLENAVLESAGEWEERLDAQLDDLSEREMKVMRYVVGQTRYRRMSRVTCPGREVADAVGISHKLARGALESLVQRGMLIRHSRGHRGKPGTGKAAIFGLADPDGLVGT